MPPTTRVVSKASRKKSRVVKKNDPAVDEVVARLKRLGTKKQRDAMSRYAIPSDKAFGVSVGKIRDIGKQLGRNHDLAQALWDTGWYEARMLAAFVDDPA